MNPNFLKFSVSFLIAVMALGCSDSDDGGGSGGGGGSRILPAVAPLVNSSLPQGLQSVNVVSPFFKMLGTADTSATKALVDFFTAPVGSISGLTADGVVYAYLNDLDNRTDEITSEASCLSATPTSVAFDTGAPTHSLTVSLSCYRSFGGSGDQSGAGSGLAYGRDANYYYLYLILIQQANSNDRFGYVAKIDRATDAVELLFLESSVPNNRKKFFHISTTLSPKTLQFATAGFGDSVGPVSSNAGVTHVLSSGARIAADETLIRVDGTASTSTNSSGVASSSVNFTNTECFDATSITTTTTTCSSPTFTMDLVTSTDVFGTYASDITGALISMTDLDLLGINADQ